MSDDQPAWADIKQHTADLWPFYGPEWVSVRLEEIEDLEVWWLKNSKPTAPADNTAPNRPPDDAEEDSDGA